MEAVSNFECITASRNTFSEKVGGREILLIKFHCTIHHPLALLGEHFQRTMVGGHDHTCPSLCYDFNKGLKQSAPFIGVCTGSRFIDQNEGIPELLLKDRKSTRLNSSHVAISYAVFCLKKKN